MDHIEAYECGFAGLVSKTDPNCDQQDMSGFVQRNTRLHHLYLHDTRGEGIYFGNTGYPSRKGTCDGKEVDLIPHTHEGVWIYDSIIEDTGWDGAQIGVSPKDCHFYRNRIARVGLSMEEYQMQGLQIGGGSQCTISDNFLSSGPAVGIIVLDASDTLITNNVVTGFETGIYLNDRETPVTAGASYAVLHNTVVDSLTRGIAIFGSLSANNAFINNLIVNGGDTPLGIGGEVDVQSDGNLVLSTLADAVFVDSKGEDYQLAEGSPAIDAGIDASAWRVETDQRGAARDASPDAGAFEFGADAPKTPNSPPGGIADPDNAGGAGAPGDDSRGTPSEESGPGENSKGGDPDTSEEGGCSMASHRRGKFFSWWFSALAVGLLLGARRRSAALPKRLKWESHSP
jgi:parallel beta-helix repeat protein